MNKKQLGQFYTHKNIFKHPAFINWFNNIPIEKKQIILEPFAGQNGIIKMLSDLKMINDFISYDIASEHINVIKKDTINDFPKGYSTIVTNPPFLAKNSATRRNLSIEINPYNDLYELCLNLCLENSEYVAVIIPESYIVSSILKKRLTCIISLAQKHIFKDTEQPVCLALFDKEETKTYEIYKNKKLLGNNVEINDKIESFLKLNKHSFIVKYNNPLGNIGVIAIDATNTNKKIRFTTGEEIDSIDVNGQSRLRTRFTVLNKKGKPLTVSQNKKLIKILNQKLEKYRVLSHDIQLTAFKGMRDDGCYRRRLDFTTMRKIVNVALNQFE